MQSGFPNSVLKYGNIYQHYATRLKFAVPVYHFPLQTHQVEGKIRLTSELLSSTTVLIQCWVGLIETLGSMMIHWYTDS